ncbi:MAG: oxidoreductase [Verrucomicrobia bacterium]|nr:oxidoreductase [Verrucomicrobiota bacterium]
MIIWLVLLPFAGGVLAFALARWGRVIGLLTTAGTFAVGLIFSAQIWQNGPQRYLVGGWSVPLGINFFADGLSAVMLLITGGIGTIISLYSISYFAPTARKGEWSENDTFWPLWLFLVGGLNALFLSADVFNVYVTLEVVTLAAIGLAALAGNAAALTASLRYLFAALIGSMAYLMGVALLYASYGLLDFQALQQVVQTDAPTVLALSLMTVGLLLKTALFPLHFWLPPAHSTAPAPVSAALSGLVVKGSFYITLRLWFETFYGQIHFSAGQLLGALGTAAILWGSFQAVRQKRLKLLIAYSTVGQIGYLFLLFPIITATTSRDVVAAWAWSGGLFQAISHALAKTSMFLSAGVLLKAVGTDEIKSMRGIAGHLPLTTFALALAGISLIGLPPSGGFVAKWLMMKAIIGSGQWWWIPVVTLGGLLTAGYVFLMLRYTFLPQEANHPFKPVSPVMQGTAFALAVGAVVIGFRAKELITLLNIGMGFPEVPVLENPGL